MGCRFFSSVHPRVSQKNILAKKCYCAPCGRPRETRLFTCAQIIPVSKEFVSFKAGAILNSPEGMILLLEVLSCS